RRQILLTRKEQRHIYWNPGEYSLFDRRQTFASARNLDEEVWASAASMKLLSLGDRVRRIMGKQRRNLHRYPAIGSIGPVVNRPEEIGSLPQVLERKLEKERLA